MLKPLRIVKIFGTQTTIEPTIPLINRYVSRPTDSEKPNQSLKIVTVTPTPIVSKRKSAIVTATAVNDRHLLIFNA